MSSPQNSGLSPQKPVSPPLSLVRAPIPGANPELRSNTSPSNLARSESLPANPKPITAVPQLPVEVTKYTDKLAKMDAKHEAIIQKTEEKRRAAELKVIEQEEKKMLKIQQQESKQLAKEKFLEEKKLKEREKAQGIFVTPA